MEAFCYLPTTPFLFSVLSSAQGDDDNFSSGLSKFDHLGQSKESAQCKLRDESSCERGLQKRSFFFLSLFVSDFVSGTVALKSYLFYHLISTLPITIFLPFSFCPRNSNIFLFFLLASENTSAFLALFKYASPLHGFS